MSSFIFARHGTSQANKEGAIAKPDSPLAKEGIAQARKLAKELQDKNIVTIVASPLPRAKKTAETIAKKLGITEVLEIEDLRERGFGRLEGKKKSHPSEYYYTVDGKHGVESIADIVARQQRVLQTVVQLSIGGTVLVVGHATAGYFLQQVAQGKINPEQFDPPQQLANAMYTKVDVPNVVKKATPLWPLISILAGLVVVAIAVFTVVLNQPSEVKVKQTSIPLSADDYKDDPRLQKAIQDQLQKQQDTPQVQTPAQQSGADANALQPVQTGIPANQ